jgi:CO/xanthine dehydrogenase FAD-binding subunit
VSIIAGGTDLIPRMRAGDIQPRLLVDLHRLHLDCIELKDDLIHIGANVTHSQIIESSLLAEHCPLLVEAALEIAGPPVRNRATVGGNLVNASPAADLAPPLLSSDAFVVLARMGSNRQVPMADFFVQPGKTVITPGEVLTEVCIPRFPGKILEKFIKLGKRKAMAISVASVATRLSLNIDGKIAYARIALGSVAPTPMRAMETEEFLEGRLPSQDVLAEAGRIASSEADPISDLRASADYRRRIVAVLTRRVLNALVKQWDEVN